VKHEIIQVGSIGIRFLLESADTNGALAMFEFTMPIGAKMPLPHSHKHYDETIYGIQGVVTFTVEGKTLNVGPGESGFIPRGAVHAFNNLGHADAKALAVITPALLGPDFFKEAAAVVNAGGPPDIEKMKAVMLRHGLVPVIPASGSR
jgi:quercetin dioxygenase-like cupin family protein